MFVVGSISRVEFDRDHGSHLSKFLLEGLLVYGRRQKLDVDIAVVSLLHLEGNWGQAVVLQSQLILSSGDMLCHQENSAGHLLLVHLLNSLYSALWLDKVDASLVQELAVVKFLDVHGADFSKFLEHGAQLVLVSAFVKVLDKDVCEVGSLAICA